MEQNKRPLEEFNNNEEFSNKRFRTDNSHLDLNLLLMNRDVGLVIGKGGGNIKSIRSETGARINIPKQIMGAQERIAELSGTVEEVTRAIQLIASSLSQERPEITVLAESKNLGAVIGKGGSTINQIRDDTGAKIDIRKECIGNSSQKEIRFFGDTESVHRAIESVVQHLAEGNNQVRVPYVPNGGGGGNFGFPHQRGGGGGPRGPRNGPGGPRDFGGPGGPRGFGGPGPRGGRHMMQPGYGNAHQGGPEPFFGGNGAPRSGLHIETHIMVPNDIIGRIIGKGGASINGIRNKSGANINVSSPDGDASDRRIIITGGANSREMATAMIESVASQAR